MTVILIDTSVCLLNLLYFCYSGKITAELFELMCDCFYECNWPELSIELQKYFVIMIQYAQTPAYYEGCKMITLNMETFTRV